MPSLIRRYTDVLSLLDMIRHQRLTLLSPSRWYDQNDTFGLDQYGRRRGDGSVFALCLAEGVEQAHHWQIFAGHSHGLCVEFDRDAFVGFLDALAPPVLHGPMIYQTLTQLRARDPFALEDLPFLKRATFRAEKEYRIVAWQDELAALDTFAIPMPLNLITRVTLGPNMPPSLGDTLRGLVKETPGCAQLRGLVKETPGCAHIKLAKSRLTNNAVWTSALAKQIAKL